jgi:hypothetical protein
MSVPHHQPGILRRGVNKGLRREVTTTLSPAIHRSPTAPAAFSTEGMLGHYQFNLRHITGAHGEVAPKLLA